jgi:hypothetical protein
MLHAFVLINSRDELFKLMGFISIFTTFYCWIYCPVLRSCFWRNRCLKRSKLEFKWVDV